MVSLHGSSLSHREWIKISLHGSFHSLKRIKESLHNSFLSLERIKVSLHGSFLSHWERIKVRGK